jgi:L-fuconolactonase
MSDNNETPRGLPRREFLAAAAAGVAAAALPSAADAQSSVANIPIIDAHIHLFDGTRPQGATYMGSAAYRAQSKVSTPELYAPLARPTGIVGAIVVESSGWIEDNLWYLEQCRANPIMVGVSGRLDPLAPGFGDYITRWAKDPLYRAIRASRYYTADGVMGDKITISQMAIDNMKLLAQADLALDTANPSLNLMNANVKLADAVPELRVIMDHLPSFDPTPETQKPYEAVIKEMAARPNIFVKLTEVYHPDKDGKVSMEYEPIRKRLDYLFKAFGEDRVMFGTDYPNSYGVATIPQEVELMKRYYSTKTRAQAEKYFWQNSQKIYKWKKRTPDQPSLT